MILVKILIVFVFPVLSLTHPLLHHSPCCHANPSISSLLRSCLSDEVKIGHISFSQRAECENKREIIFLYPRNVISEAPEASSNQNGTFHLHSNKKFSEISSICLCGEVSKKCHLNAKCVSKDSKEASIALESLEHICVSKEILIKLERFSRDYAQTTCDQILNNQSNKFSEMKTADRPNHNKSKNIKNSGFTKSYKKQIKNTKDIIQAKITDHLQNYKEIYESLKKPSSMKSTENMDLGFTKVGIGATSALHYEQLMTASLHQPSTTKRHRSTNQHPSTFEIITSKLKEPKPNHHYKSQKQFSLKTLPELRKLHEWLSKHSKLPEEANISNTKPLKKWIKLFFENKNMTSKYTKDNKVVMTAAAQENIDNNPDVDSFDGKMIFNSKLSQKRQAESYPYNQNSYYAVNDKDVTEVPNNSTNVSAAIYDTFLNRQVLLWFSSLAEPRWIKSHIHANTEKFSLYVVLFVFLGVISTMGAVIYRLFFQVKSHKNYIIGKKTVEKENIDENEDENDNGEKEKDPLQKEQQEGEEKFNSPGNWRTPESESSTGDDRTLRDDEHGNTSNIERADSRHVMCTIVSQERSLDEISQMEQRQQQHDVNNNNQPEEQAPSAHMMASMLQETSSPPLSAITSHSSPPQSPNIHHQPQHHQPGLPSPPGSFMFEPPTLNQLNPINVDSSIVTVHSPKMIDDDTPDVNTLARRSRELY